MLNKVALLLFVVMVILLGLATASLFNRRYLLAVVGAFLALMFGYGYAVWRVR